MKNETVPLRILVIDDDALSRDVLALLLEHVGYIVETADSGDAALHQLDAMPVRPNIILADIQMPGTAGGALAHALRKRCGTSTLLLAMSGSVPDDRIARKFDGLLLKPFTTEELTAAISTNGQRDHGSADPDGCDLPSLDEAIYSKLAASMRQERLQQLYTVCLKDVEERTTRMRKSASNNEEAAFRREAHAIRGGAGMVGAAEVQSLAAAMEMNGIDANHVASLDRLTVACNRLRRILMTRFIM